ncbi:MAG: hypothetical protein COB08_011030 [Rhodobacteraceae bacterium]|nr:hypothetical protein [Paracoccaceae bacterium]
MKYPTTMQEATQAAHDERSKALFDLLHWGGKAMRKLASYIVSFAGGVKPIKPAHMPKTSCPP